MGRKVKYSAEEKINAVKEYLDGKDSMSSIAKRLDIALHSSLYQSFLTGLDNTSFDEKRTKMLKDIFLQILENSKSTKDK